MDYYLDQSGGLSKEAERHGVYVVKPDGSTVASFVRLRSPLAIGAAGIAAVAR